MLFFYTILPFIQSSTCIHNPKDQISTLKPSVASVGKSSTYPPPLTPHPANTITRSISIACWIVVFSPQILENFRRSSADGLSVFFIMVWLSGDVCNILGAVLQGVLPTMTILAVYYAFADTVLLSQCFYYRGFRFSDTPTTKSSTAIEDEDEVTDESPLIYREPSPPPQSTNPRRRKSTSSSHSHKSYKVDPTHLSPATPLLDPFAPATPHSPPSALKTVLFNTTALALVIAAGIFGWWISRQSSPQHHHENTQATPPTFDTPGQVFGYACATLYLSSRFPQLLLNHRRKSTEGVSMLFFLFACVGNLTYVLSIFAYEPGCAKIYGEGGRARDIYDDSGCGQGQYSRDYWRYIAVNASWIVGSAGTLCLDLVIFGQFWAFRDRGVPVT